MRRIGIIILLCGIPAIYIFAAVFDNETLKVHPFVQSASYCTKCHSRNDRKISDQTRPCADFCYTCHQNIKNHHAVDVKITEKRPGELRLTDKKRLTCVTCHSPENARFDGSSWKAESLYERTFGAKSRYKTYFLIKQNNDGQLCKTCH